MSVDVRLRVAPVGPTGHALQTVGRTGTATVSGVLYPVQPGQPLRLDVSYGWPVRTAMVLIAFTYCITGLHKLQYTGLAWASSDNLRWVLYTASDSQNGNSLGLFIANHPLLSHLFAWGTLVLECTFPLALLWPVSRWLYVPGVVGMHAGIYATMHLNYVAMASTVVIVYVNWAWIADRLKRRAEARARLGPAAVRT